MRSSLSVPGVLGLALACALTAACGSGQGAAPRATETAPSTLLPWGEGVAAPDEVHILSPWQDGHDKPALKAVVSVLREKYPAATYQNDALAAGGAPWQWNWDEAARNHSMPVAFENGYLHRGTFEGLAVRDLTGAYETLGLAGTWPDQLFDRLATGGRLRQLPLMANRTNLLLSSPAALREAGLDPSATYGSVDEWIEALRAVKESGAQAIELGYPWMRGQLLENLLLADLGPEGCRGLWDGRTSWDDPRVGHALAQLQAIADIAGIAGDEGTDEHVGWTDVLRRLEKGKVGFLVTGDWAFDKIEDDGFVFGRDVAAQVAPGTAGSFGFAVTSYLWPEGSDDDGAARAWFETISSAQAQHDAAVARAGVPVRTDVDRSGLRGFAQEEMTDWSTDDLVVSTVVEGDGLDRVTEVFRETTAEVVRGEATARAFQDRMNEVVRG